MLIPHPGPNSTTFIVPGECFPTRYRSTSHGISAASGKIGSIIGQAGIATLRTRGATSKNANPWLNHVMQIYALFMFLGIFTTLCIPETKRKTLEQLAGEDPMTPPDAIVEKGSPNGLDENDAGKITEPEATHQQLPESTQI
jgi:PHS family inorganic phosphate transporter-like MFS transporter